MHYVTIAFKNPEDAKWARTCVDKAIDSRARLAPLYSGILLDALTRAETVVESGPSDGPITGGGPDAPACQCYICQKKD